MRELFNNTLITILLKRPYARRAVLSCFAKPTELEAYLSKQFDELRRLAAAHGNGGVEVRSLAEELGGVARRHKLTALADQFDAILASPST